MRHHFQKFSEHKFSNPYAVILLNKLLCVKQFLECHELLLMLQTLYSQVYRIHQLKKLLYSYQLKHNTVGSPIFLICSLRPVVPATLIELHVVLILTSVGCSWSFSYVGGFSNWWNEGEWNGWPLRAMLNPWQKQSGCFPYQTITWQQHCPTNHWALVSNTSVISHQFYGVFVPGFNNGLCWCPVCFSSYLDKDRKHSVERYTWSY